MEITAIQEIINNRAKNRLANDLSEIYKFIDGNRLTRNAELRLHDGRPESLSRHFYFDSGGSFLKEELIKKWLPIYIKEEAEMFVKKVDSLQEQVEELYAIKQDN